jgi:hypothetical protein
MASGLRIVSASVQSPPTQVWFSGEVDFMTYDFTYRLSGENISASGVSAFMTWGIPAGATAYASGTASGGSAMWMKMSATAAHGATLLSSARVLTTSGKNLVEWFTIKVITGQLP